MVSTTIKLVNPEDEFPEKNGKDIELSASIIPKTVIPDEITETPNLTVVEISKTEHGSFGFNVVGGIDSPHLPWDTGIFVSRIDDNGPAVGLLHLGDKILKVNDTDISSVKHDEAVNVFRAAGDTATFLVDADAELRLITSKINDTPNVIINMVEQSPESYPTYDEVTTEEEDENNDDAMSTYSVLDDVPQTPKRPLSLLDPGNPSIVTELIFVSIGIAVLVTGALLTYRLLRRN